MTDWQLGVQAFHEGRMREAADRLQAAVGEDELAVTQAVRYETCAYLGAALYALGLPGEALTAFELAVQFSPTAAPPDDLLMNLAHAYLAAGRRSAARETLRFLLTQAPGHVAAGMLAARLDETPDDAAVSGAVLGASPETAENYIRTLTFSQPVSGGYAPAEVHEALGQLQKLITTLIYDLREAEAKNAQNEMEIFRYRQMEDAVVENMMQFQPAPHQPATQKQDDDEKNLSPIEILFRQKP